MDGTLAGTGALSWRHHPHLSSWLLTMLHLDHSSMLYCQTRSHHRTLLLLLLLHHHSLLEVLLWHLLLIGSHHLLSWHPLHHLARLHSPNHGWTTWTW